MRRDPQSTAKETKIEAWIHRCPLEGCEAGGVEFPAAGGVNVEAVGRGGSTTSEDSRTGIGGRAGGCACAAMSCNRPPT